MKFDVIPDHIFKKKGFRISLFFTHLCDFLALVSDAILLGNLLQNRQ